MDSDREVQPDYMNPSYRDMAREYPAARCRECNTITHVCTANGTFEEYTCRTCRRKRRPCSHTARQVKSRDTELHLDNGWKLATSNHKKGCSKPPSRLALLMMLQDQAPELEGSDLEARLIRFMEDEEVQLAADELLGYLGSVGCD